MVDIHKNIIDYNPIRKIKILVVLVDMIADIKKNNKNSSHSHRTVY